MILEVSQNICRLLWAKDIQCPHIKYGVESWPLLSQGSLRKSGLSIYYYKSFTL